MALPLLKINARDPYKAKGAVVIIYFLSGAFSSVPPALQTGFRPRVTLMRPVCLFRMRQMDPDMADAEDDGCPSIPAQLFEKPFAPAHDIVPCRIEVARIPRIGDFFAGTARVI